MVKKFFSLGSSPKQSTWITLSFSNRIADLRKMVTLRYGILFLRYELTAGRELILATVRR
jgi:hypothetical protein